MLRDYLNVISVLCATDFKTADVLTRLRWSDKLQMYLQKNTCKVCFSYSTTFFSFFF